MWCKTTRLYQILLNFNLIYSQIYCVDDLFNAYYKNETRPISMLIYHVVIPKKWCIVLWACSRLGTVYVSVWLHLIESDIIINEFSPGVLLGSVLLIFFSFLCCSIMCIYVRCCDIRYDFRITTMFGSSLPPVVCRRARVLFTLFVFVCA